MATDLAASPLRYVQLTDVCHIYTEHYKYIIQKLFLNIKWEGLLILTWSQIYSVLATRYSGDEGWYIFSHRLLYFIQTFHAFPDTCAKYFYLLFLKSILYYAFKKKKKKYWQPKWIIGVCIRNRVNILILSLINSCNIINGFELLFSYVEMLALYWSGREII